MSMRALLVFLVAACGGSSRGELLSIEVEPANATIVYTNAPVSRDYTAIGRYEDGTVAPLDNAVFSLDVDGARLGQFSADTFTVNGQAAGKGGVIATVGDLSGATGVIVTVHVTDLGPGVPPGSESMFPDTPAPPGGAMSQAIVYPLDRAIMPTSVKAPMIQWEGPTVGASMDLYRVRLVSGFATVDAILADTPGKNYLPSTHWQLLVNSTDGSITTTLDHWDATNGAQGSAPIITRLVTADIAGAIYYWNLGSGEMERIDAAGRAKAIPVPPEYPPEPGNRCVACHTVSRDGRYLSGSMWGGGREGAVFDLSSGAVTQSTVAAPAPTINPLQVGVTYTQLFTTFNPDATRLMINNGNVLELRNPRARSSRPPAHRYQRRAPPTPRGRPTAPWSRTSRTARTTARLPAASTTTPATCRSSRSPAPTRSERRPRSRWRRHKVVG
jgi:mono/diheme cytochrome c family protein